MNSAEAGLADEVIGAGEGLARFMSQLFTAENRSAGAQLLSFADQLRTASVPLLEQLLPLARDIAAVFAAPRAGDYEALLIEVGYKPIEARLLSTWAITTGESWAKDLVERRHLAVTTPMVGDRRARLAL